MIPQVSSLANMEMALYGGFNSTLNTPSYLNGYSTNFNDSVYSPNFYGYGNNWNNLANNNIYSQTPASNSQAPANTSFKSLSKEQIDALTDFYSKSLDPSESFATAAILGGTTGVLMANPRTLVHPWNSMRSFSDVKEMFKGVKENGSALNQLWKENHNIMEEAYSQMQRTTARSKSKLGLFRKRYSATEYNQLKKIMQDALDSKDINKIAEATEKLRHAQVTNGYIAAPVRKGWNKVSNLLHKIPLIGDFFGGNAPTLKVADALKQTDVITANTKTLISCNKRTLGSAFKKAGGKVGLVFGLLEIAMNLPKITMAYAKDKENAQMGVETSNGSKQLKQTTIKAVCNTLGWAAGETLGIWAFTKAGAAIGTALGPGIGTIVGAAVGFIGGSIGMWLGGKIGKALVGNDVSNKIQAEQLVKTQEGQNELLTCVLEKAKNGDKIPPEVQLATAQILQQYQI